MRNKVYAAAVVAAIGLLAAGCSQKKTYPMTPDGNAQYLADNKAKPGVITMRDGLQYHVIAKGNGMGNTPTAAGDLVKVSYTGSLVDGKIFDATKPGETAEFEAGNVMPGWVEALQNMQEGDELELVIPAKLGFGAEGWSGKVPPGATLIYQFKFVSMKRVDRNFDDASRLLQRFCVHDCQGYASG